MIQPRHGNSLGQIDVVADTHRPDDRIAQSDAAPVADTHRADRIVDRTEILDHRTRAERKRIERNDIQPRAAADDRAFPAFGIKPPEQAQPSPRPSFDRMHHRIQQAALKLRILLYFLFQTHNNQFTTDSSPCSV